MSETIQAFDGLSAAGVKTLLKIRLEEDLPKYKDDPKGFVHDCFQWEEGEGPDVWQDEFLTDLGKICRSRTFNGKDPVEAIRMAVASGHGIGKGAMIAWLHWWIMCTRPHAKGTVTANTFPQLQTKTWPEIKKWHKRLLVMRDRFEVTDTRIFEKRNKDTWFSAPLTCSEENSEAFAGQHNRESTSFYLFDEASNIPDIIWEVAQQGLSDGEPMMFAMGNPTRNTGEFYEVCFGKQRHRWNQRSIDARTCKVPNKSEQQKLIEDHGLDSDICRMRVLGQPPQQSEVQLIGRQLVEDAQRRDVQPLQSDPLVAGVDVPDGGSAWFVVRFRRGLCARPGPLVPAPARFAGSKIDRETMIAKLAEILSDQHPQRKVSAMFIDAAYGAPIVERLHALNHKHVHEIRFGGPSADPLYANMRALMWGKHLKEWLRRGAIDPNDKKLAVDLMAPGFHHRVGGDGALVLESKQDMQERGIAPVDDADALALTFARKVAPAVPLASGLPMPNTGGQHGWMG